MLRHLLPLALLLASATATAETLVIDGVPRTYELRTPQQHAAPLVLVLHGNTEQGRNILEHTTWPEVARREGFVLVAPDGLNRAWADFRGHGEAVGKRPPAGTDDVKFLTRLVDDLVQRGVADPQHIYVAGISNGGAMAMSLACVRPDLFAAASSTIMAMTRGLAAHCHPSQGTPMLFMNGTEDPLVNFNGGRGTNRMMGVSGLLSTEDTLRWWRGVDGCARDDGAASNLPDRVRDDNSSVTRIGSHCPAGSDVLLYRINGGGHRLPDTIADSVHLTGMIDRLLGRQNRDIQGPQVIWDFLKQFARH